jgi:hypothetical protein
MSISGERRFVKLFGLPGCVSFFCIEELMFDLVIGVPLDSGPNTPHRKEFMQVDLQMMVLMPLYGVAVPGASVYRPTPQAPDRV